MCPFAFLFVYFSLYFLAVPLDAFESRVCFLLTMVGRIGPCALSNSSGRETEGLVSVLTSVAQKSSGGEIGAWVRSRSAR